MNIILPPERMLNGLDRFKGVSAEELRDGVEKALCERSFIEFVKLAWKVIEPANEYVHNWHADAIAEHLEAVTRGEINRLLINVPPGTSKSTLCGVLWPAWEWTLAPHLRFLTVAHSEDLAIRDTVKMRRLVQSDWYQGLWGDKVVLRKDQNEKGHFENEATGFRQASPSKSLTGKRGDRVIFDDPHSVSGAASKADREQVIATFMESLPTRLNSPLDSAIVVVMQRLHEGDVSGHILSDDYGYEHLMLPMRFERDRKCYTSIGWEDPRVEEGELLFPERFPLAVVDRDEKAMGSEYVVAGQMQQRPVPRGGGILRREWWVLWDDDIAAEYGATKGTYPRFDYVLASLDGAYTAKAENDPSALTIWGCFADKAGNPKIMLVYAWAERLEFPDLLAKVKVDCERFDVDCLIIEAKATGHSIAQEIKRGLGRGSLSVRLIDPRNAQTGARSKDKVMRAHAVTAVFEDGIVMAPDKRWAEAVIMECEVFPKGKYDDRVDSVVQALEYFRTMGFAMKREEVNEIDDAELGETYGRRLEGSEGALYDC